MKNLNTNLLFLLLFNSLFFSCTNSNKKSENTDINSWSNSEPKSITILCENQKDNAPLFDAFKLELENNDFKIEEFKHNNGAGFDNCDENTIISMKGKGIRSYFARSSKPAKNAEDFFPDFQLDVFEFSNEKIAREKFEIMDKALQSDGRFCNGKAPQILVINKNEVFLLATRAEMFRGYIEDYAKFIEKN